MQSNRSTPLFKTWINSAPRAYRTLEAGSDHRAGVRGLAASIELGARGFDAVMERGEAPASKLREVEAGGRRPGSRPAFPRTKRQREVHLSQPRGAIHERQSD